MKKLTFTNEETAGFLTGMKYLIHAGTGNADALHILAEDEPRTDLKRAIQEMAEKADEGRDLSDVIKESACFPEYLSDMLSVGERSGKTEESLGALAADAENRAALDRRMKSALLYPALLLLIMLAVIAVLLIYVLPIFNRVYAQLGGGLTGIAGSLLGLGKAMGKASPVLIAIFCVLVALLAAYAVSAPFRAKVTAMWQKKREGKGLAGKINTARFARALSMGMSSGMPVEEALEAAARLLEVSAKEKEKAEKCIALSAEGTELGKAMRETELLPAAQCRILEAGIRSGAGEEAMDKIAEKLEEDSENAIEDAVSRVEPAIVTVTSVLVGLILLAVMLPLINIMAAIG